MKSALLCLTPNFSLSRFIVLEDTSPLTAITQWNYELNIRHVGNKPIWCTVRTFHVIMLLPAITFPILFVFKLAGGGLCGSDCSHLIRCHSGRVEPGAADRHGCHWSRLLQRQHLRRSDHSKGERPLLAFHACHGTRANISCAPVRDEPRYKSHVGKLSLLLQILSYAPQKQSNPQAFVVEGVKRHKSDNLRNKFKGGGPIYCHGPYQ